MMNKFQTPMGLGFEIKDLFFDRKAVIAKLDPKKRKFLSRFGSFVMRRAKSSIKPGGKQNKTSKPGEAPRSHTKLIRRIFFAFDPRSESVVIGPVVVPTKTGGPKALEALEYGGPVLGRKVVEAQGRDKKGRFTKKRTLLGEEVRVTIEARPFMTPAFEEERGNIPAILRTIQD